jgi:hypothetical protein
MCCVLCRKVKYCNPEHRRMILKDRRSHIEQTCGEQFIEELSEDEIKTIAESATDDLSVRFKKHPLNSFLPDVLCMPIAVMMMLTG